MPRGLCQGCVTNFSAASLLLALGDNAQGWEIIGAIALATSRSL